MTWRNSACPKSLRIRVGVRKEILTIPVRKPNKQDFFRVRPGQEWRLEPCLLQLKEERETYLVSPSLWAEVGRSTPTFSLPRLTARRYFALWAARLPDADGRYDDWSRSALEAAEKTKTRWIRLAPNMSPGAYEIYEASAELPEPGWPDLSSVGSWKSLSRFIH